MTIIYQNAQADMGIAQQIAAQAVLGSAKLVLESGKHPGQLKDEVRSPFGSTIRGVVVL